jgi:hypothetical protein
MEQGTVVLPKHAKEESLTLVWRIGAGVVGLLLALSAGVLAVHAEPSAASDQAPASHGTSR